MPEARWSLRSNPFVMDRLHAMAYVLVLGACGGMTVSDAQGPSAGGSGAEGDAEAGPEGGEVGRESGTADSGNGELPWDAFMTADKDKPYVRSSSSAPRDVTGRCSTVELEGTINGVAVEQLYDDGGRASTGGPHWLYAAGLPAWGVAELQGESDQTFRFDELATGTRLMASHPLLFLPHFLPHAESLTCVRGPAYYERASNHVVLEFGAVGFLPSCADASPVPGALDLHIGWHAPSFGSGMVDGIEVEGPFKADSGSPACYSGTIDTLGIRVLFASTGRTTARVSEATLWDGVTGLAYCAGPESYAEAEPEMTDTGGTYAFNVHLRDLRRLGDCNEIPAFDRLTLRICASDW